jgi:HAD superfamily phosphatase
METIVVFDMDGVLAEVTESYREAIVQTVKHFTGKTIERDSVQDYKNQGGWNNDWLLSQKIASDLGVEVPYQTVVDYFNEIFIGKNGDGLIQRESWIPEDGFLQGLQKNFGIALFTGRLQYEADITLKRFASDLTFDPMLCADHVTNSKPHPEGLLTIRALKPNVKLWYVGDTVDDARSARAAGVPFIGIAARNHSRRDEILRLFAEEAAVAVVETVNEMEPVLKEHGVGMTR